MIRNMLQSADVKPENVGLDVVNAALVDQGKDTLASSYSPLVLMPH